MVCKYLFVFLCFVIYFHYFCIHIGYIDVSWTGFDLASILPRSCLDAASILAWCPCSFKHFYIHLSVFQPFIIRFFIMPRSCLDAASILPRSCLDLASILPRSNLDLSSIFPRSFLDLISIFPWSFLGNTRVISIAWIMIFFTNLDQKDVFLWKNGSNQR